MDSILLIAAIGVLVALLTFRWPVETSLGIYAVLLPFDTVLVTPPVGGIHLHATWAAAAMASAVLIISSLTGRGFVRAPRPALWLSLFVMWAVLSASWAANFKTSSFRWPVLMLLLGLYLVAAMFRATEREISRVAWLAILGGCAAAAITVYQFSQGQYWIPPDLEDALVNHVSGSRATLMLHGEVTDPNILAASLILPLALAFGILLDNGRWFGKLVSIAAIAILSACIFLTMSRGALVAICILFAIFVWRSRASWRILAPLTMMAAVVAGVTVVKPQAFADRFQATFDDRGAGRLDIWNGSLEAFKRNAVVGVGLDGFPDAVDKYRYVYINTFPDAKGSHNIYVGIAVDLGIVGLILLLGVIAAHFHASGKILRGGPRGITQWRLISYEAAAWGLLTCGVFLDLLWESYFWMALMLIVMAVRARHASPYAMRPDPARQPSFARFGDRRFAGIEA